MNFAGGHHLNKHRNTLWATSRERAFIVDYMHSLSSEECCFRPTRHCYILLLHHFSKGQLGRCCNTTNSTTPALSVDFSMKLNLHMIVRPL